jgi:hypothetical protein
MPDERHRALEHAIAFARGRRQELDNLRQLVPTGGKDAGLPPRWYGELAGELVGLGLLDGPHYPPGELKILAKVLGYYLWCALAAAESDRGNEPGCRRVLDGIVSYLGLPRLQNFDFNQLQPRQGDTFRPFELTVLVRCLEPHLAASAPPSPPPGEADRAASSAEPVPSGMVEQPSASPTSETAQQQGLIPLIMEVMRELQQILGRIDDSHRQLSDHLERGEIEDAKAASARLRTVVVEASVRLRVYQDRTGTWAS